MGETSGDGAAVMDHFVESEEGCGRKAKGDLGEGVANEADVNRGGVRCRLRLW